MNGRWWLEESCSPLTTIYHLRLYPRPAAGGLEYLDDLRLAVLLGEVEGGAAVLVLGVHVGAVFEEEFDALLEPLAGGGDERRPALRCGRLGAGPLVQEQ